MQLPTLTNIRLRSTADAHAVIHAARTGLLRMVDRRLDSQERAGISVGSIYVWEERGALDMSGMGIERWTDGIRWGPSRLRNDFLYYQQREDLPKDKHSRGKRIEMESYAQSSNARVDELDRMIKQTYSVHVYDGQRCANYPTKLHIIAYFNRRMVENLHTIDAHPVLRSLLLVPGMYRSARVGKQKNGDTATDDTTTTSEGSPELELIERQQDTLPPILVAGLRSPMLSNGYSDFANRSPTTPYHLSHRDSSSPLGGYASPSGAGNYGNSYWTHGNQDFAPETDNSRHTPLPSLRSALPPSAWSPTQRYVEDDMQLARLDIARGLV